MRHKISKYLLAALFTVLSLGVMRAADGSAPVLHNFTFADKAFVSALSDNGQWALASGTSYSKAVPKLINVKAETFVQLGEEDNGQSAADVTNDGNIVVGSLAGKPAYYNVTTGKWTTLPVDKGGKWDGGAVEAVTPDGKYAVGALYAGEGYNATPALWDLTTGQLVATPGLPTLDLTNENKDQGKFTAISADGRYILGTLSWSYLPSGDYLGGCCVFLYDRQNSTYKMIGFEENHSGRWTPWADGLLFTENGVISPNGRYVAGDAYVVEGEAGFVTPYLYDTQSGEFKVMADTAVKEAYCAAVSSDGVLTVCTPGGSPVREWYINYGKYWFSFSQILKQKYGIDFYSKTGFDSTGTVVGISADGMVVASFPDPYCGYVAELPVPLQKMCEGIRLLGTYTSDPAAGAAVSSLTNVSLTFGYAIQLQGKASSIKVKNSKGEDMLTAFNAKADGKTLKIVFRNASLSAGENYTLYIPEGTICIDGDTEQTNAEISIPYSGRAEGAVKMTEVSPADNSALAKIDFNTNPVILTFDAPVKITENASAYLYANEDEEPVCQLIPAVLGNKLALYPATTQYLFEGSDYRVVLSAGSVTDLSGNGPNEQITVKYRGSYVREISPDDIYLFNDNMSNDLINFLLFDGDRLEPTSAMQQWEFTSSMAWHVVRDDDSSDFAACSHSMYSPAGKSDDWMVVPQIYVPDELCRLTFDSQSYLKSKQDRLKVYVWESNNTYNTLTAELTARIREEGKLVYDKVQSPGEQEGVLAGEWTANSVSLAEWAGKNIYIAFVNDNEDQSAVFVDNIQVLHEMHFMLSLSTPSSVVAKNEVTISGTVLGNNADKAYSTVELTLLDAAGSVVDTYRADGLSLGMGDKHSFTFSKPLPLTVGIENKYSIAAKCDDETNTVSSSVKALIFQPVKRVVLEEFTGRDCPNCPLGILGIDKLKQRFGDRFIPIGLHCYMGSDPLGVGLNDYASYLGLVNAPSAVIDRGELKAAPAFTIGTEYYFSSIGVDAEVEPTWSDLVSAALEIPTDADITIYPTYKDDDMSVVTVDCDIRSALTANDTNFGLFTVLLQDNVSSYQQNNLGSMTDPDLGEFGKDGKYSASLVYPFVHEDAARAYAGSFAGTVGLIPQDLVAGQVYKASVKLNVPEDVRDYLKTDCRVVVMIIDANTGKVVNAAVAKVTDFSGVGAVEAAGALNVTANGSTVSVTGNGTLNVSVYSASGALIGMAQGTDALSMDISGYNGMAIVKAVGEAGSVVKKIIVK